MPLTESFLFMSGNELSVQVSKEVDGFALEIDQTFPLVSVTAIFGPSGAGKTTLLRMIAGLEKPDRGIIKTHFGTWLDTEQRIMVPAHKRPVGYMFQGGQLFPHLSVEGNLTYAEKRSRGPAQSSDLLTFDSVVAAFHLSPLLARQPATLSGGERQRVALARTILTRPTLLLLDEPLAGLDYDRKLEILPFLKWSQASLRSPPFM